MDPCTQFPENLQQPEMHHIAVFEPENPGFFGGAGGTDIAVYPSWLPAAATAEHAKLLAERSCAIVRYRDDASPFESSGTARPALPSF